MRLFSRKALCCLACFAACLSMIGCASGNYGKQITRVEYYPACYAPLQDLRSADSDFNRTVAVSTATGAILGAVVGLLATKGKPEGALVGAAAGGALGAGAGYAKAKQDRIADDNQRMSSYLRDIDGDISGLDRATAAAQVARKCYDQEFKSAIAAYKAGKMPRQELQSRYSEIRDGCTETSTILGSVITAADNKEKEYQGALTAEAERAGKPVPVVSSPPAATSPKSAPKKTAAKPQKKAPRNTTDTSLEAVARSTQDLGQSKRSAQDEQDAINKMQEEMDGTLATLTA